MYVEQYQELSLKRNRLADNIVMSKKKMSTIEAKIKSTKIIVNYDIAPSTSFIKIGGTAAKPHESYFEREITKTINELTTEIEIINNNIIIFNNNIFTIELKLNDYQRCIQQDFDQQEKEIICAMIELGNKFDKQDANNRRIIKRMERKFKTFFSYDLDNNELVKM